MRHLRFYYDMKQNPTRVATFLDGGYVVHGVRASLFKGKATAWFDAAGGMLRASVACRFGCSRSVVRDGPIWRYLDQIGPQAKAWSDRETREEERMNHGRAEQVGVAGL